MSETINEVIADMLRDCRELMNDSGAHWVQGAFNLIVGETDDEYVYGYCSIGSIRKRAYELAIDYGAFTRQRLIEDAVLALGADEEISKTLLSSQLFSDRVPDEFDKSYARVVLFNDTEGRSWPEIEGAFKRTEDRLRATV